MSPAAIEETQFEIRAGQAGFQARGEVVKFKGFLALSEEQRLKFENGDKLEKKPEGETGLRPSRNRHPAMSPGKEKF